MAYCISYIQYYTIQYRGSSGDSKDPPRKTHLKLKRLLHTCTVHRYRNNPDMRAVCKQRSQQTPHYQTYFDVLIVKTHHLHRIVRHVAKINICLDYGVCGGGDGDCDDENENDGDDDDSPAGGELSLLAQACQGHCNRQIVDIPRPVS